MVGWPVAAADGGGLIIGDRQAQGACWDYVCVGKAGWCVVSELVKSGRNIVGHRDVDNFLGVLLLLYWSNPVSQVLRAMAFKRTTRGRSNFGELMTVKIS
jgi:hypothetical protein